MAWKLGARSPMFREAVAPIGLRTRQAWYGGRVGAVELCGGHRVVLGGLDQNYLSFELFWRGWTYYEPYTALLLRALTDRAASFVDVGANVGYFTLTIAGGRPDLEVVAFEPNPKLSVILEANIARNHLGARVERVAVSSQRGVAQFYLPHSDMSGSLESGFNAKVERVIDVPTITLDDALLGQASRGPMVVKIDAEGHEPAILRGSRHLLRSARPDLILEVTSPYDQDVVELLRSRGYRFYNVTHRGLEATGELSVAREGDLLFLNTLVTTRPDDELRALSSRLAPRFAAIDPRTTCHLRPVSA